ncbi:MAG TPA: hypothetical protein VFP81_01170, partial [Propionibacteriaceae bacterium]|nr:hypothetical protein [Propionibacteriaceae bacterium]
MEPLPVVVERNYPGNLGSYRLDFCITQRITSGLYAQLKSVARLFRLNPNLAFIVAIEAESQSHHSVEAALVAMAEAHQSDFAQVEWTHDWQRCRLHHRFSLWRSTDTSYSSPTRPASTLGGCQ